MGRIFKIAEEIDLSFEVIVLYTNHQLSSLKPYTDKPKFIVTVFKIFNLVK